MSAKEIRFNINHTVKVKLNDRGRKILKDNHDRLFSGYPVNAKPEYHPAKEDDEGWSKWQLHSLMSSLGNHCFMGPVPPFETEIIIVLEN
jgi:hypothetical protein